MSKGTILITGATGLIGSALLIDALQNGYSAHIVVRSESKARALKEARNIVALNKASACKYFIVPDLGVEGCMDEAATGADYVIHCATPLPFRHIEPEKQREQLITPAVNVTLSVLESARKATTIRRIIVLGSLGAFATPDLLGPVWIPETPLSTADMPINEEMEPPFQDMLTAYCASKTAALRRSLEWMADAGDHVNFDLLTLAPTYVFGRYPLPISAADLVNTTSNGKLLRVAIAKPGGAPHPIELAGGVHLDDIVKLTSMALDLDRIIIPPSDLPLARGARADTITFGVTLAWNDAKEIIARKWPEAVRSGLLPNGGDYRSKTNIIMADGGIEERFGFKLKGLEEMLDTIIPQYLVLLAQEK